MKYEEASEFLKKYVGEISDYDEFCMKHDLSIKALLRQNEILRAKLKHSKQKDKHLEDCPESIRKLSREQLEKFCLDMLSHEHKMCKLHNHLDDQLAEVAKTLQDILN